MFPFLRILGSKQLAASGSEAASCGLATLALHETAYTKHRLILIPAYQTTNRKIATVRQRIISRKHSGKRNKKYIRELQGR